jgi:hypothetical protein
MRAKIDDQTELCIKNNIRPIVVGDIVTLFLIRSLKSRDIFIPAVRYDVFKGDFSVRILFLPVQMSES